VPPKSIEVPVLIVGGGPAGLTSSLALSRYGLDSLLVNKHPSTAHTPRAHIVNQRTVEILRHLGIEDQVLAHASPPSMMRNNLWVTSLTGREIARREAWGTGVNRSRDYEAASPSPMANCPQTVLEPILRDAAQAAGGDVRFGHEFRGFQQDADKVTSLVRDRESGDEFIVYSDYLLGADGARSDVLAGAGLTLEGPSGLGHAANIWFRADLSAYLAHRPGVLTMSVTPGPLALGTMGVLICHKPFSEFVLVVTYDPAERDPASFSNGEFTRHIHRFIGNDDVAIEILGAATWQINGQVATHYSSKRVHCLGDAVHRHPPANGLGLNLSIADAYNVAWKLALVLRGQAGAGLLDTYSQERQPAGAQGVARSLRSVREIAEVPAALGVTDVGSVAEGWAALEVLDDAGPVGTQRRQALQKALKTSDYQFNAHGVELGYRYQTGALIPDGEIPTVTGRDPELYYTATTSPGARVPHARLERCGKALSSLDLINGLEFMVLTGLGGEDWLTAAGKVSAELGISVKGYVIGGALGAPCTVADPYGEWTSVREVGARGCVLVRPDRHVAWRCFELPADPEGELLSVLEHIVDHRLP
jgi:2,4-dichlorophenol 6-monooxygenase